MAMGMGWRRLARFGAVATFQSYTPNSQSAQGLAKIAVNLTGFQPAVGPLGRRSTVGETLRPAPRRPRFADSRIAPNFLAKVCTAWPPASHHYLHERTR